MLSFGLNDHKQRLKVMESTDLGNAAKVIFI